MAINGLQTTFLLLLNLLFLFLLSSLITAVGNLESSVASVISVAKKIRKSPWLTDVFVLLFLIKYAISYFNVSND